MVRFTGGFLLFSALALAVPTDPAQVPLRQSQVIVTQAKQPPTSPRKLQGKFLHITDFHPDPFYIPGSSSAEEHACHSGTGNAGTLGAETTACDTPIALINATFQWINDNLKDELDFVIWTGDSARHDNDERFPRSGAQVIGQNKLLVSKFTEVFGKDDNRDDPDPTNDFIIPIIPTFGNNDILPHNIFEPGPNKWTRWYASVWNKFIPEEQRHSFERGGWYFVEVIRNRLAVFSLNTLYFFDSNSAVDGCDAKSEPGYEHMEWLRVQLELLRQRGMKAIITGHVPPARTVSKQSWDESCWQKYTLWMRQYRDVVVGAVYGHANIDHFLIQDMKDLEHDFFLPRVETTESMTLHAGEEVSTHSKSTYLNELREVWSALPEPPPGVLYSTADRDEGASKKKKSKDKIREEFFKIIGGPWAERFSFSLVSPSVVPNYYPTLRVFEYNITGIEDLYPSVHSSSSAAIGDFERAIEFGENTDTFHQAGLDEVTGENDEQDNLHDLKKRKKKPKGKRKPPFKVPRAPDATAPPGPAYSPQTFTFLSYVQYYANLTHINNEIAKIKSRESNSETPPADVAAIPHLKHFKYDIEYDTKDDKIYQVPDLTMRSYLDLAVRIGRKELGKSSSLSADQTTKDVVRKKHKNTVWHNFVKRAFVLTKPDEELEDKFDS